MTGNNPQISAKVGQVYFRISSEILCMKNGPEQQNFLLLIEIYSMIRLELN
jgi:hypothetical protein